MVHMIEWHYQVFNGEGAIYWVEESMVGGGYFWEFWSYGVEDWTCAIHAATSADPDATDEWTLPRTWWLV